jgi:hypothetical protein
VNDYVGLEAIDISHIDLAGSSGEATAMFENGVVADPDDPAFSWYFSDTYSGYRIWDNYAVTDTITEVTFVGAAIYGDDSMVGNDFNVGFRQDAGGIAGAIVQDEVITCTEETAIGTLFGSYTIYEFTLDVTDITLNSGWVSVQMIDSWEQIAVAPSIDYDLYEEQFQFGSYYGYDTQDMAFKLWGAAGGGGSGACYTLISEGFETDFPPAGWSTSTYFWLDSLYGVSHGGTHHAYSYSNGDSMVTPTYTFESGSTTLTFWYAAESSSYPQELEVYVDGTSLVWSDDAITNDDMIDGYLQATVDLSGFTGDHFIEFVNVGPTGLYGVLVDDIVLETCEPGEEPEGDSIMMNMVYQIDMTDPVYLEVYGFEWVDGETCEGCDDPDNLCANGMTDWELVATFDGNTPGECLTWEGDLAEFLEANDTHFCLRFRLETGDLPAPGIGIHIHELGIEGILYDPIMEVQSDFYEDFEDGNLVNEDSGIVWERGCVTYGTHWEQIDDFKFCTVGSEEAPECADVTLTGVDSYGDGWDSDYDYAVDAFIDVTVNGVLVVDDFTVTGSVATETFEVCEGDVVEVTYDSVDGVYEGEHSWTLEGPTGVLASGVGGDIGTTTIEVSFAVGFPAEPVHEALIWSTEIMDAYEAVFEGEWNYDIGSGCNLKFEMSADGGDNWYILRNVDGPAIGGETVVFDLTPWAGSTVLFRVMIDNHGIDSDSDGIIDTWFSGKVCVENWHIYGKQDMLPPTATISLSGNSVGPGLYAGPVTVTINAVDDMGMGEIHYILDGTESVVSGNKATFKVSDDGDHTVEYWPVDATGNEGAHGTVSFSIDNSPPTVALTAPEPGLYLFGNKLLGMSKPFIIGAFTAEATADDAQGVAVVKFMLNGEVIGEDTEAPFDTYVAVKNMGAATLKVVAEDGVGNTAEDSMDITYYKFL